MDIINAIKHIHLFQKSGVVDMAISVGRVVAPGFVAKVAGGGVLGFGAGIATNMVTHGGWLGAGSTVVGTILGGRDKRAEKEEKEKHKSPGMWSSFMSTIGGKSHNKDSYVAPANSRPYDTQGGFAAPGGYDNRYSNMQFSYQ